MTKKRLSALFAATLLLLSGADALRAQTTKVEFFADSRRSSGIYQVYIHEKTTATPAPEGYKPFYISHYGRHGSRWLLNEKDYANPYNTLLAAHNAGKLTPLGESLFEKLAVIKEDARGRYGDLTRLGVKEHRAIAERMFKSFPEVFSTDNGRKCIINARSTTVPRCIISMAANNERLKELNPAIEIERDAAARFTYLNNTYGNTKRDSVSAICNNFVKENFNPERFLSTIFNDKDYSAKNLPNPVPFLRELYLVGSDLPDVAHLNLSIFDIFTKDELFVLWQATNMSTYFNCGPSAINGKVATDSSKQLLRDILDCASAAIKGGKYSADLRFGHDSYIIPLAALMDLEGMNITESDPAKVYKVWSDFKVSPMGVNLQMVFYRKGDNGKQAKSASAVSASGDDVLVKFLYCEKEVRIPVKSDIAPYYRWADVEAYYRAKTK